LDDKPSQRANVILIVDDDDDDCELLCEAFADHGLGDLTRVVHDGEELMDYLRHNGAYSGREAAPRPDLILLDLNMPRMNGHEALLEIRADAALRAIPIVVLSTSQSPEDVVRAYDNGVNSFMTKPDSIGTLNAMVETLSSYWFSVGQLPPNLDATRA
jgi:CheY-like chemotaxis protein